MLAEEILLAGKFFVPKAQKVTDAGKEQLRLHATVEELEEPRTTRNTRKLRPGISFRVFRGFTRVSPLGRYLVFPSQFNRDDEDAPEPKGKQRSPSTGRRSLVRRIIDGIRFIRKTRFF